MIPSEGYVFHWQTNSMKSVKCTPTSEKQVEQPLRKDMQLEQEYRWYVSLYTKFFLYHEACECYFVSLLMLIFIVHTLNSMIGIFHHLRDFSWEKVNRFSNMEHISTIFIDVLSSNIFIFL